jgi:hypothetical protein
VCGEKKEGVCVASQQGDDMKEKMLDKGLEEIDEELADIDKRLKKVLSQTDSVLKEWKQDAGEEHEGSEDSDAEQ